jgi:hypothetical protein
VTQYQSGDRANSFGITAESYHSASHVSR